MTTLPESLLQFAPLGFVPAGVLLWALLAVALARPGRGPR